MFQAQAFLNDIAVGWDVMRWVKATLREEIFTVAPVFTAADCLCSTKLTKRDSCVNVSLTLRLIAQTGIAAIWVFKIIIFCSWK